MDADGSKRRGADDAKENAKSFIDPQIEKIDADWGKPRRAASSGAGKNV
jgi:hypothetical protein